MKRDRIVTAAIALLLGACLGISGVLCLATGFHLESFTSTSSVVTTALLLGILGAVAFSCLKGGYAVLAVLALVGGYLWRHGDVDAQLEKLLYMISRYYHFAYGWGIITWSSTTPMGTVSLPLGLWAGLTALLTARALCRRKSIFLPLLLSAVPVISTLVVTDTPPSTRPLFFFLLSAALLLMTHTVRRRTSHRDANRLTALLLIPVAAAFGLLLHVFPSDSYRYADKAQQLQDTILHTAERLWNDGLSDVFGLDVNTSDGTVDLQNAGPMEKLSFRVMDVTSDQGGTLYLRERDFSFYAYTYWGAVSHRTDESLSPDDVYLEDAGDVTIHTVGTWDDLLLPYYPADSGVLIGGSLPNTEKSDTYTVHRMALRADWQQAAFPVTEDTDPDTELHAKLPLLYIGSSESSYLEYIQPYLSLPSATEKWALELAGSIVTQDMTTPEKAQAVAAYVRGSANYSLNTPAMPEDATDFAQWFLEESDTGYCVHFATATVVLLRAVGIPARYVEGYMVSTRAGQKTTVTAGEAHAWAEYYIKEVGWIPLESTPAITGTASPATSDADATTVSTEPVETTSPRETTGPTSPTAGTEPTISVSPHPRKVDLTPLWTLLTMLGILLLLCCAAWGQWFLRRRYRTRRGSTPNASALVLWQEVTRAAHHLAEDPPEELTVLAQKAKFSHHALTDEELSRFTDWLKLAQVRLKTRPWYRRIPDRLIWALY